MAVKNQALSVSVPTTWIGKLNSVWHEKGVWAYVILVVFHQLEHIVQAFQVFVLRMPRPQSLGLLGFVFPALVRTEILHFAFAVFTLAGLLLLYPAFRGRARLWWVIAIVFQTWHFLEHALLQGQVLFGFNLFGASVPTSLLQLWIPRVELHLIYNTLVTVPTVLGIYYHFYPPMQEALDDTPCTCARRVH